MTQENQPKRSGKTKVTSVSLSDEFKEFMVEHKISPTEAMRRGIAVMMYDLGVLGYQTDLNKERSENIREFLNGIKELESLKGKLVKLKELLEQL